MTEPTKPETWGELGPAMQALNARQRNSSAISSRASRATAA